MLAILKRAVRKGLAEDVARESRPEGEGVFQTEGRTNAKALWYQELKEDRKRTEAHAAEQSEGREVSERHYIDKNWKHL